MRRVVATKLVAIGLSIVLFIGCGGDDPASQPTPDVDATVASAIKATTEARNAFETQVAHAVEATRQAEKDGNDNTSVSTSTPVPSATSLAPTTTVGKACEQDNDCANGERCQGGVCVLDSLPTPTPISGCEADGDCLPGTRCEGGVCVSSHSTPGPNPFVFIDPEWKLANVGYMNLTCTDFHPGIEPPNGPSRWYEVAGQVTNLKTSKLLAIRLQLVDVTGKVLSEASNVGISVPSFTHLGFNERFDLPSVPEGSRCRVTFSESGFAPEGSGVAIVELDRLFGA